MPSSALYPVHVSLYKVYVTRELTEWSAKVLRYIVIQGFSVKICYNAQVLVFQAAVVWLVIEEFKDGYQKLFNWTTRGRLKIVFLQRLLFSDLVEHLALVHV